MPKLTSPTATEVREFLEKHRVELTPVEAQQLHNLASDIDNITPKRWQEGETMRRSLDRGLTVYAEMKKRFPEKALT